MNFAQHERDCFVAFEMRTDVAEFIAIWDGKVELDAWNQALER